MKKTTKVIFTSLILSIITTVFGYANFLQTIHINEMLTIEEKKLDENSEFFKSQIKYPVLKIKKEYIDKKDVDAKIIENINNQIASTLINFRNDIKAQSEDYKKTYNKKYMKYQYEAVNDYKISYNENNIISIPITMYQFTGGAHGLTNIKSFNYDLSTGKELMLKDMFKEGVDYKSIVNKSIQEQIDKDKSIYFVGKMGFNGISDNQNFYIDNDGIVVYFGQYEIAPYSTGIPQFKITWEQMGKI